MYNIENTIKAYLLTDKYVKEDKEVITLRTKHRIIEIIKNYYFEFEYNKIHAHKMILFSNALMERREKANICKYGISIDDVRKYFSEIELPKIVKTRTINYTINEDLYTEKIIYVKQTDKGEINKYIDDRLNLMIKEHCINTDVEPDLNIVNWQEKYKKQNSNRLRPSNVLEIIEKGEYYNIYPLSIYYVYFKVIYDNNIDKEFKWTDFKELLYKYKILINNNDIATPTKIMFENNCIDSIGPKGGIYLTPEGSKYLEQAFKEIYFKENNA